MRILLLTHPQVNPLKTRRGPEGDVLKALLALGHDVRCVGAGRDLREVDEELRAHKTDLVFNLLEEFRGEAVFDFSLPTYLEALNIPVTGCNPRGLVQSRNKYLVGLVAAALGLKVPQAVFVPGGQRVTAKFQTPAPFPLFVKLNREHASLGIHESNRVLTERGLRKVCDRLRTDFGSEILVQEFVAGRDVSVSLWGNRKPYAFKPRLLHMGGTHRVSTARLKFNRPYQISRSLKRALFQSHATPKLLRDSRQLYEHLDLSGYARFDYRVTAEGIAYLIDVNANPSLAKDEDFALSALSQGLDYAAMIDQILKLARSYRPRT